MLEDEIGLQLLSPDEDWRHRPDMDAERTKSFRTPFISFFTPPEILGLARECGFRDVQHVSAADLGQRYFAGRRDGLRPPYNAEELLVATA